jgi:hypothetical protein
MGEGGDGGDFRLLSPLISLLSHAGERRTFGVYFLSHYIMNEGIQRKIDRDCHLPIC